MPEQRKRETRAEFKERLQQLGLWLPFKRRRQALRLEGWSDSESAERARAEFPISGAVVPSEAENGGAPAQPEPEFESDVLDVMRLRELATGALGQTADVVSEVSFVATHLGVPVAAIEEDRVPSARAINMLAWYRQRANQRDFWNLVYNKLLPSKSQIEADARLVDDGQPIFTAIADCLRRVNEAGGTGPGDGPGA